MDNVDIQQSNTCPAHRASGHRLSANLYINVSLFSAGTLINIVAYRSLEPLFVSILFYLVGTVLLHLTPMGGSPERRIFRIVFTVGWFWAGVAAFYANYLNDLGQTTKDAAIFYMISSGRGESLNIPLHVVEGAGAIFLWKNIYDFFTGIGFDSSPYIGIVFNVFLVAMSGVVALKSAKQIFGQDIRRLNLLSMFFSTCGLLWLFAAIHLRDAIVLLAVTSLAYVWLYFLAKPDIGSRLLQIIIFSLLAGLSFGFLRREFVFVPIAMAMAGVAALMFGRKKGRSRLISYVLVLIGLTATAGLLVTFGEAIQLALFAGNESYLGHALDTQASDSLGVALIVKQPTPIRLVLGSVYLFVFPIPFWSGFQLDSALHLFKSFNVLFFYFVTPLMVMSVWQLLKHKDQRTPALLFILFLTLGFTLAIAGTSLETRHFGAFLAPMFVLALLPDLRMRSVRNNYKSLLFVILSGVVMVHALWVVLKLA